MKLDKAKNILLIIFIFVSVLSILIVKPFGNLDEIWNYNTARAISEGLIPYKDVSMITTPLLSMIASIFLKLVLNQLIVMKILGAIISTVLLYMMYKILKLIFKDSKISVIFTAIIAFLLKDIFTFDYNLAVLMLSLIILFLELKNLNKKEKYSLIVNTKNDLLIRITGRISDLYETKHRNNISSDCSYI